MKANDKGFSLIEVVAAVSITSTVMLVILTIFTTCMRSWSYSTSTMELNYNAKETIDKLTKEIQEGYRVEIIDDSGQGWIKIYKTQDLSQFVSFRLKNNKIFLGLNNIETPNCEFSNFVKAFKTEYYPEGCNQIDAKGVKIYLKFGDTKNCIDLNTCVTFRNI